MQSRYARAVLIATAWCLIGGTAATAIGQRATRRRPITRTLPNGDADTAVSSRPRYPSQEPLNEGVLPSPTATATPPVVDARPRATFTFADGSQLNLRCTTGRFRLVGLHLNETVDIAVQFFAVLPSSSSMAQSLDGGKIISFSINSGGVSGLASIRFQAGNQPGLYRIRLAGAGASPLLQFWVADPNNPKANLPVLNPGH